MNRKFVPDAASQESQVTKAIDPAVTQAPSNESKPQQKPLSELGMCNFQQALFFLRREIT